MSVAPENAGPGAGGEAAYGRRRLLVPVPMDFVIKKILEDCYRVYDLPRDAKVQTVKIVRPFGSNESELVLRMEHPDFEETEPGHQYPSASGGRSSHWLPWDEEEGE